MTSPTITTRGRRSQLTDVIAGWKPGLDSGFALRTGHSSPATGYEGMADWSASVNIDRIGPGTVMWIVFYEGTGLPFFAGFLIATSHPKQGTGAFATEWFVPGYMCTIRGLWVPGDRIRDRGWPEGRVPWGSDRVRPFPDGQRLNRPSVAVLLTTLPPSGKRTLTDNHLKITGSRPWWHWASP